MGSPLFLRSQRFIEGRVIGRWGVSWIPGSGARKSHSRPTQGTRGVVVARVHHVYAALKLSTSTSVAGGTPLEAISIQREPIHVDPSPYSGGAMM